MCTSYCTFVTREPVCHKVFKPTEWQVSTWLAYVMNFMNSDVENEEWIIMTIQDFKPFIISPIINIYVTKCLPKASFLKN
jgi:hypothetical protein